MQYLFCKITFYNNNNIVANTIDDWWHRKNHPVFIKYDRIYGLIFDDRQVGFKVAFFLHIQYELYV